ncbi:hypothetical protein [Mycobacterium sp. TY814]|nr:hypothetical protein [Mycobacterium sp. TY814]MDP7723486.1 hypothetical protein [Mycobacterium sp. TY814]
MILPQNAYRTRFRVNLASGTTITKSLEAKWESGQSPTWHT